MTTVPEESEVRSVLRSLRGRSFSGQVQEDIETLERVLQDPLFRQLSKKSLENAPRVKKRNRDLDLVEFLRTKVEERLKNSLAENQRLVFCEFDVSEFLPTVLETDKPDQKLIVVGPSDIKNKSGGRIRIGDRVQAIASRNERGDAETKEKTSEPLVSSVDSSTSPSIPLAFPILFSPGAGDFDGAVANSTFVAVASIRENTNMVLSGEWTQVEAIRLTTENGGLGFGIVGGTSTGVVVKTILPGSPADKDKRLKPGDHILQIGNVSTHGMTSQQVATILRQQDTIVELVVGRPVNYAERPPDTQECWTMTTRAALNAGSLEEYMNRQKSSATTPSTSHEEDLKDKCDPSELADSPVVKPSTSMQLKTEIIKEEEEENSSRKQSQVELEQLDPGGTEMQEQGPSNTVDPPSPSPSGPDTDPPVPCLNLSVHGPLQDIPESPPNSTEPPTPTTSRISLRTLQEMALTVFLRENWDNKPYDTIEVELKRDQALGLGITVAGYVHRKEEIAGVFVKSLVPRSAASHSKLINVHDLILKVNGISLEHMSHADSVRTLVKSGNSVKLSLIRFPPQSPQAQCLKMLQEQETETQVIDVQSSNPTLAAEWKKKLKADDVDIVSAVVKADRKEAGDGGLGISLEGTVDVVAGHQLCPHHYIESLRQGGPAAKTGLLRAGDELLQVNHSPLYGESHITVRQALTRAVNSGAPVTLVIARKTQHLGVYEPSKETSTLPLSYPLLAAGHDRIVKAKSEVNISFMPSQTDRMLRAVSRRLRSRSLEPLTSMAVWNCVPLIIHLDKDTRGLGFSVVDYQDPLHPGDSVIVVQSLVPGGVAQADGRIVPGDRLLFVNNHDLSNSSLERAVASLKAAPMGRVRLGIAKPIPVDQCVSSSHSPLFTRSERLLARESSPRGARRRRASGVTSSQETVWIGAEDYRRLHPQGYYPSSSRSPSASKSLRSLADSEFSMASWSPCSTRSISPAASPVSLRGSWAYDVIYLPTHLERNIKINKGSTSLGVILDADRDKGVNGCVVKNICGKKSIAQDSRIQVGDFIVKINTESLRNVTSAQATAILKRENLIGTNCSITYITSADARTWKERFHRDSEPQSPSINRLSPKVFPKFYRSPYLNRKESGSCRDTVGRDETEPLSEASDAGISEIQPVEKAPKEEGKKSAGHLVDGTFIDSFVHDLIKEALNEAILELAISHKIGDWNQITTGIRPTEEEVVEEEPSTSRQSPPPLPPSREQSEQSPIRESSSIEFVEKDQEYSSRRSSRETEPLIRRDSEPVLHRQFDSEREDTPTIEIQTNQEPSINIEEDSAEEQEAGTSGERALRDAEELEEDREEMEFKERMRDLTSRTPSTGSDNIQAQAKQLAKSKFWGEARTVTLHREPNKSFGISIVGGRVEVSQKGGLPGTGNTVSGIFIKSVLPNSPAGKSGMMSMGDRVISVNEADLRDATHEQAVAAIKNATNPVRFVLQSLHSFTPQQQMISSASNSTVGSIRTEIRLEEERKDECIEKTRTITVDIERPPPEEEQMEKVEHREETIMEEPSKSFEIPEPEPEPAAEEPIISESTDKIDKAEENHIERSDSRVSKESRNSQRRRESSRSKESADKDQSGSRKSSLKREASDKSDKERRFSKSSILSSASRKSKKEKGEEQRKASYASGPLIVSDVSSSENHEEEESPHHRTATNNNGVLPSKSKENTQKKYADLEGEILTVHCEKVPEAGLGISLAGNKNRDINSVFVIAVKIACPLPVRKGDELLEVNGRVLRGLSHLVASNMIREASKEGALEITLCRREGALDDCAVREDTSSATDKSNEKEMPPTEGMESNLATIEVVRKKSFSVERTAPIETGKETFIEIDKEGKGLGLSIVGGSDTVLGTVVIHEVYSDGAAAHDGRLQPGDQVLEVNNISLRGVTHDVAISSLRRTPPKVRLLIYRDDNLQHSLLDPTQIYNMFEVELQKKPGRGLGLSIVGRKNEPGVYVSEVVKGGAAEADGRLMTGDQILAVNSKEVANSMQEDVAAMLKTCVGKVHLKVGRWKIVETTNKVHAAAEAAKLTASMTTPRPNVPEEDRKVPSPAPPMKVAIGKEIEIRIEENKDLSPVEEEKPSTHSEDKGVTYEILKDLKEDDCDTLMVELRKMPDQQLGMGIGKRSRGILVTSLQPGSNAAEKLKVGDRIMAVNGLPVTDQLSAVTFVKSSGERLFLQIARPRTM